MYLTLDIAMRPIEGALVRALSLVERRGYPVRRVTSSTGDVLKLELEVELGTRSAEHLVRKLEGLEDVCKVDVVRNVGGRA